MHSTPYPRNGSRRTRFTRRHSDEDLTISTHSNGTACVGWGTLHLQRGVQCLQIEQAMHPFLSSRSGWPSWCLLVCHRVERGTVTGFTSQQQKNVNQPGLCFGFPLLLLFDVQRIRRCQTCLVALRRDLFRGASRTIGYSLIRRYGYSIGARCVLPHARVHGVSSAAKRVMHPCT